MTSGGSDQGGDQRAPYDPMPHGPAEVGVGPWQGPPPTDPRYDPSLLAGGDRRNVVDRYRYWTMAAIVADLDARRHDFHVAIENWQHDFNIGTIVRSANAFLAAEVHIVGNRRWNRRGAMVTDRYQHIRHHATPAELADYLHSIDVRLLGIDNLPGSAHLETMTVPRRVCFLFGQEGPGTVGVGAGGLRRDALHRPVRLDPLDQRVGRGSDRHALLDQGVRRPVRRRCLARLRSATLARVLVRLHAGGLRGVRSRCSSWSESGSRVATQSSKVSPSWAESEPAPPPSGDQ